MTNKLRTSYTRQSLLKELFRKGIHASSALVPALAEWNLIFTIELICMGIFIYIISEVARITGAYSSKLSSLVIFASRRSERGFSWGPVTLGFGLLLTILCFSPGISQLAIFAVAFGDGAASLAGKFLGNWEIPWIGKKTLAGTLACFTAVFISSYIVLGDPLLSLITAAAASALELVSLYGIDNILIPLGTGLVLHLLLI